MEFSSNLQGLKTVLSVFKWNGSKSIFHSSQAPLQRQTQPSLPFSSAWRTYLCCQTCACIAAQLRFGTGCEKLAQQGEKPANNEGERTLPTICSKLRFHEELITCPNSGQPWQRRSGIKGILTTQRPEPGSSIEFTWRAMSCLLFCPNSAS